MTTEPRTEQSVVREGSVGRRVSWAQMLPLFIILLLAVQLRLTFYQGVINTDDLTYSHLAERMAEGVSPLAKPLPDAYGALRIGLYGPVAIAYKLFGVSSATTLAWPFTLSLLGIVGAYVVGRLVRDEAAGLLSAFLLAVLPTNVAAGTALLGDGPIAALSVGTVGFLLVSSRARGWRAVAAIAGSLLCFTIGVFNKPLILLLLPFLIVFVVVRTKRVSLRVAGAVLVIASACGYILYFGMAEQGPRPDFVTTMQRLAATSVDLWQLVIAQREFAWIVPLWIVALVVTLAWRKTESRGVMAWLGLTFLYGELGTRTFTMYTPIVWYDSDTPARHLLLIATPAMILTGIYLADGLRAASARWTVGAAAVLTGIVTALGIRGAQNMTWGITLESLSDLPFATISGVAAIVVVFGGLATPVLIRATSARTRVMGTAAILIAIGLGSLTYSYAAANGNKAPWVETLPQVVKFLQTQPPLPVFVQNASMATRLDFFSGYRLGFASTLRPFIKTSRIQIAPDDANAIAEGYVLVDDYQLRLTRDLISMSRRIPAAPGYMSNPPARFSQIADLGSRPDNHVRIFRVSRVNSESDLAAARLAAATDRNPTTLRTLLAVASGAGAYCEAARAWFDLRQVAPKEIETFNAVPILTECYTENPTIAGPNLVTNGDFSQGTTGWSKHPDADATITIEKESDGVPFWHTSFRKGNWQVINQTVGLRGDTAYVYEATVRSTVPLVALYWQSDIGRHFTDGEYRSWTTLRYVFVTRKQSGLFTAGLNPVLMPTAGEVWIKNVRVSELKRPPS